MSERKQTAFLIACTVAFFLIAFIAYIAHEWTACVIAFFGYCYFIGKIK